MNTNNDPKNPEELSQQSDFEEGDEIEEAPPLPLSDEEPPVISSLDPSMMHDDETLAALTRLAGAAANPEAARTSLHDALTSLDYDARFLPDTRTMLLGIGRALIKKGLFTTEELINEIMADLEDGL